MIITARFQYITKLLISSILKFYCFQIYYYLHQNIFVDLLSTAWDRVYKPYNWHTGMDKTRPSGFHPRVLP